jgi:hypothetical protein
MKSASNFALRIVAGAVFVGALGAKASANSVVFNASGTFYNSTDVLGGTITIDTTSGSIKSVNLTVTGADSFVFNQSPSFFSNYPGTGFGAIYAYTSAGSYPYLSLLLPTNTLVGYTGGNVGSLSHFVDGYASGFGTSTGGGNVLATGSFSAATPAAPLPSAVWGGASLLGLMGIGAWVRRRVV